MTNEEMRSRINSGVRWVAHSAFGMTGEAKYAKAYDKLNSRFYLDHGISLSSRLKESTEPNVSVFDVLIGNELNMLLESLYKLEKMYNDVIKQKDMAI